MAGTSGELERAIYPDVAAVEVQLPPVGPWYGLATHVGASGDPRGAGLRRTSIRQTAREVAKLTSRNGSFWYLPAGAFVVLVCAHLESFSFGTTGLLGGLVIAGVLSGALMALCGLFRRRQAWIVVGLQLALVPLAASMLGGMLAHHQQRESFRRGDDIATALASYHNASGSYPESLSALIPACLIAVPASAMGVVRRVPFDYSRDTREGHFLSVASPTWVVCHRTAQTPWVCDD